MTQEEQQVLNLLAQAYNQFIELEMVNSHDLPEFVEAIHRAQNIVLARPTTRELMRLKMKALKLMGERNSR